jgi:hypothetical protein
MKPETCPPDQPADTADSTVRALRAVQLAMDRRDNGGEATVTGDQ